MISFNQEAQALMEQLEQQLTSFGIDPDFSDDGPGSPAEQLRWGGGYSLRRPEAETEPSEVAGGPSGTDLFAGSAQSA